MAGVFHLWSKWEVQILVLASFSLQVLLLTFAGMRRRNISPILRIMLWLMYLLADSIAVYTLGHMSIGYNPGEHQQFMAFWASFLLVHLGGQDTITAYAMEDNNLWLRHLFNLVVQAAGAAYVLYKYIPGSETSFMAAAVLMFAIGVIKYGERVWSLKTASLDSVSEFLDGVKMQNQSGPYPARGQLMDDEVVLQGAHDLLHICMGQFVDYNIWPSEFQSDAMKLYYAEEKMYELIEMQLSLMYDVFYTKAVVIQTWHGFCIRAASLSGTVTACFLFHFSAGKYDYSRIDAAVTYVLLIGASLLEVVSVLGTLMSTWTCAAMKRRRWDRLHSVLVSIRRLVKAAPMKRRWSGSIGQHNLVDSFSGKASLISRMFSFFRHEKMISETTKGMVLNEIFRMVVACQGSEDMLRSYQGHQFQENMKSSIQFDESILMWHFATDVFLFFYERECGVNELVEATKAVSDYMMFLLVEHPYMLPSPVRSRLYISARPSSLWTSGIKELLFESIRTLNPWNPDDLGDPYNRCDLPITLAPGAKLANGLLRKKRNDMTEVLKVVFRMWVEKLSYASHHCSRDSHARQLNNGGGEFITVVWLLTSAVFKSHNSDHGWFRQSAAEFFKSRSSTDYKGPGLCERLGERLGEACEIICIDSGLCQAICGCGLCESLCCLRLSAHYAWLQDCGNTSASENQGGNASAPENSDVQEEEAAPARPPPQEDPRHPQAPHQAPDVEARVFAGHYPFYLNASWDE